MTHRRHIIDAAKEGRLYIAPVHRRDAIEAVKRGDADQPRDEKGQFAGGGSHSAAVEATAKAAMQPNADNHREAALGCIAAFAVASTAAE